MKLRVLLILLTILLLYTLLNFYIGWHLYLYLDSMLPAFHPAWFWPPFAALVYGFLIGRAGGRLVPGAVSVWFKNAGSVWFAVFQYSLLILPPLDVLFLILRVLSVPVENGVPAAGSAALLLLAAILAKGFHNARSPVTRKYTVHLDKKAGELNRLRILVASDFHLGTLVGIRHLRKLTRHVEKLKPDLILLPGDVIDEDPGPFRKHRMGDEIRKWKAKYGIYAVLGNHEYYGGHAEEIVRLLREAGIEVLADRVVRIADRFYVAGRKDRTAERGTPDGRVEGRLPPDKLLEQADRSLPVILMDHQPLHLNRAAEAGADILLSGHTHRGQLAPNHWITGKLFELDWGYMKKGGMHVIVSSGFGTWGPPFRLGSRAEIVELDVRFANSLP